MEFGLGSYGFGFLAGLLSTLSPCVLPIIPILLGSATNAHPRAPLALAGGLALSYAVIGTTLVWAGSALGLDTSIFRGIGAAVLGLLGLVLISGNLPFKTQVAPVQIFNSIQSDNEAGAAAVSTVLLVISLAVLIALGLIQRWTVRRA